MEVHLNMAGNDLNPDTVSAIVGLIPTKVRYRDVPFLPTNGRRFTKLSSGLWSLGRRSDCAASVIEEIVAAMDGRAAAWWDAAELMNASTQLNLYLTDSVRHHLVEVDTELAIRINELIESFDIYFAPRGKILSPLAEQFQDDDALYELAEAAFFASVELRMMAEDLRPYEVNAALGLESNKPLHRASADDSMRSRASEDEVRGMWRDVSVDRCAMRVVREHFDRFPVSAARWKEVAGRFGATTEVRIQWTPGSGVGGFSLDPEQLQTIASYSDVIRIRLSVPDHLEFESDAPASEDSPE